MKRVVITGVSRGLGRAMAQEFIRLGHTVLGCGRSAKSISELRGRFDKPHDFDAVDVASDEKVKAWAKRLLKTPGPPDVLLNNAAIINKNAPLWKVSAEEFDQVVDVNLKGVVNSSPGLMSRIAEIKIRSSSSCSVSQFGSQQWLKNIGVPNPSIT